MAGPRQTGNSPIHFFKPNPDIFPRSSGSPTMHGAKNRSGMAIFPRCTFGGRDAHKRAPVLQLAAVAAKFIQRVPADDLIPQPLLVPVLEKGLGEVHEKMLVELREARRRSARVGVMPRHDPAICVAKISAHLPISFGFPLHDNDGSPSWLPLVFGPTREIVAREQR